MPNRIIKESICTSDTLASLSAEAERLFYRLMVQCDDFGLMLANPNVIRSSGVGVVGGAAHQLHPLVVGFLGVLALRARGILGLTAGNTLGITSGPSSRPGVPCPCHGWRPWRARRRG